MSIALSIVKPIGTPEQVLAAHSEAIKFIQKVLEPKVDFGEIEGAKTPSLFKPGAEKICLGFGARPRFTPIASEIDHDREVAWTKKKKSFKDGKFVKEETESGISRGFYRYVYKCEIVLPDGRVLGEAEGVCSTIETKYVDRPRDCEHTVCRMAQKRAHVAATVAAFGLSGMFKPAKGADGPDKRSPSRSTGQAAAPGDAHPKATYTGSEAQKRMISVELKRNGVDESLWDEVDAQLRARPCEDVEQVVIDMGAVRPGEWKAAR